MPLFVVRFAGVERFADTATWGEAFAELQAGRGVPANASIAEFEKAAARARSPAQNIPTAAPPSLFPAFGLPDTAPVVVPVKTPGVDVRGPPPSTPGFGGAVPRMAAPVVSPGPSLRVTPGGTMPTAGQDMRDSPLPGALPPRGMAPAMGGVLAPIGAVGLAGLLARLPMLVRGQVQNLLRNMPGWSRGARIAWGNLPSWLRAALTVVGVSAGTELLIDVGPDDIGLLQLPGTSDFPALGVGGGVAPGVSIVGGWTANGVQFYRLSDGRFAVQNSKGRWKVWRVKKPIVLFASGARDIPTFLRADKALNKQSKALKTTLNRRAPGPKKRGRIIEGQVVPRDGTRIIKVD